MEESFAKPGDQDASRRSSVRSSLYEDIRDLWSTGTMSTLNVSISDVCEDFDEDGKAVSRHRKYSQTISIRENLNLEPEEIKEQARRELEQCHDRPLEPSELSEESVSYLATSSSQSELSLLKPHQAYWIEQQNRLPLPLMDIMEIEVLDILRKALHTYRSTIGKNHFMTKELQGYMDGIRKRRNKRLYCMVE